MTSSITTLNAQELDQVSGGFFQALTAPLGSAIIGGVYAGNAALNTPLISSVGEVLNFFGGGPLHQIPDLGGYLVSIAGLELGQALGGTGSGTLHYEKEKAAGQYNFSLFGG
ncbi:MAG: hypothetical protein VXW65_00970 [Pseudomonadota bacterium]|nr:hypothetical protein [Pseudomonadota bacterium]